MITYITRNIKNGKFYIGSTINFQKRKKEHLTGKENYPFQTALRKNPELFEWETVEDDSDERILEQALLDMWYGKELCYNLSPRADAPLIDYERNYHNGILVREMKLGFHNPDYRNSDEYKQMQVKCGKKAAEMGIGIHSEEFRRTKLKEIGRKTGKKNGRKMFQEKKGIFDPNYRNSEKFMEDEKRRLKNTIETCSMSIILIDPNGDEYLFYSMRAAERRLGIPNQTVSKLAKRGNAATKGVWKGWKAVYQEPGSY
jgi:group I intron endonuclease